MSVARKVERYDQYVAWIVLLVLLVFLYQAGLTFILFLALGFFLTLLGFFLFNKGRKHMVNLNSDLVPIAFAFIILIALIYTVLYSGFSIVYLVIIIMLTLMIVILYQ